jgi:hypothetical protein
MRWRRVAPPGGPPGPCDDLARASEDLPVVGDENLDDPHHSALGRRLAGSWFSFLGYAAAALIAVGVLVPLDIPGTDFANFVGYILWSIWMLAFVTLIWRRPGHIEDPVAQQLGTEGGRLPS